MFYLKLKFLKLKLWFYRKVFGKSGYDVITSPIQQLWHLSLLQKHLQDLDYYVSKTAQEMETFEMLHSRASDEQDMAATTLENLDGVE